MFGSTRFVPLLSLALSASISFMTAIPSLANVAFSSSDATVSPKTTAHEIDLLRAQPKALAHEHGRREQQLPFSNPSDQRADVLNYLHENSEFVRQEAERARFKPLDRRQAITRSQSDVRGQIGSPDYQTESCKTQDSDFCKLEERERRLVRSTWNIQFLETGILTMMTTLPESVTKWHGANKKGVYDRWKQSVSHAPVIDGDNILFNISHPLQAGNGYYNVCRETPGFGALNDVSAMTRCFLYSAAISTFLWEAGLEAAAPELLSIQDLILTPVLGSVFGEVVYRVTRIIRDKNCRILGSKLLGTAVIVLLNPLGAFTSMMDRLLGDFVERYDAHFRIVGGTAENSGPGLVKPLPLFESTIPQVREPMIGIEFKMQLEPKRSKPKYYEQSADPYRASSSGPPRRCGP